MSPFAEKKIKISHKKVSRTYFIVAEMRIFESDLIRLALEIEQEMTSICRIAALIICKIICQCHILKDYVNDINRIIKKTSPGIEWIKHFYISHIAEFAIAKFELVDIGHLEHSMPRKCRWVEAWVRIHCQIIDLIIC